MSSLNGLLLIDKPQGLTSHDVVARARKILNTREIGHCGTLDPMATGLLVLAIGEGLKLVSVLTEGDKSYIGKIQFGISTDTLDVTGRVTGTGAIPKSQSDIVKAAESLMGTHNLQVPKFSAVKVQGERLFEKAREGEDFTPPSRAMTFFDLQAGHFEGEKWQFGLSCSKGSFVRSWVLALCSQLGVAGTLSALKRTYSYPYSVNNAMSLDLISGLLTEGGVEKIKASSSFISLGEALPDWSSLRVFGYDLHLLRNGQISKNLKAQLIRSYQSGVIFRGVKIFAENSSNLIALIGLEVGKGFFIKRGFREV